MIENGHQVDPQYLALLASLLSLQWLLWRRRLRVREAREKELSSDLERLHSESGQVLDEKNLFIKNLSYELRTPLTQVIDSLRAFSAKEVPDWQKSHLQKISIAASALDKVVSGLVDYAAIVNNEVAFSTLSFSLRTKFARICDELQSETSDGMLVLGSGFAEMQDTRVTGDPIRLSQVLRIPVEVLSHYARSDSLLYLNAEYSTSKQGLLSVVLSYRGTNLRISPNELQRLKRCLSQSTLAEEFRFADPSFSLLICHQLALRMGGRLSIGRASKDQIECSLHLSFPLVEERDTREKTSIPVDAQQKHI